MPDVRFVFGVDLQLTLDGRGTIQDCPRAPVQHRVLCLDDKIGIDNICRPAGMYTSYPLYAPVVVNNDSGIE